LNPVLSISSPGFQKSSPGFFKHESEFFSSPGPGFFSGLDFLRVRVRVRVRSGFRSMPLKPLEDSENAISNELETPYFQTFFAHRQPWWRLVAWAPQNKISRMFFAEVGNYGIMHAACTDPRQYSHLVFLFSIDLTDYSLLHNIICPRFHVNLF
jgi:hypothetical protein